MAMPFLMVLQDACTRHSPVRRSNALTLAVRSKMQIFSYLTNKKKKGIYSDSEGQVKPLCIIRCR